MESDPSSSSSLKAVWNDSIVRYGPTGRKHVLQANRSDLLRLFAAASALVSLSVGSLFLESLILSEGHLPSPGAWISYVGASLKPSALLDCEARIQTWIRQNSSTVKETSIKQMKSLSNIRRGCAW